MIAPLLPGAERLIPLLAGVVDYAYVDRMNYGYAASIYRKHRLEQFLTEEYFQTTGQLIAQTCAKRRIPCTVLFHDIVRESP